MVMMYSISPFFFFNDTATTEIYTLSLHDALPIYPLCRAFPREAPEGAPHFELARSTLALAVALDRKSTRLNSSHVAISYAVFCLKKKKKYPEEHIFKKKKQKKIKE